MTALLYEDEEDAATHEHHRTSVGMQRLQLVFYVSFVVQIVRLSALIDSETAEIIIDSKTRMRH